VVGDAVNLAQRLQSQAEGGQILASSATIAAAPGLRTEPLGQVQVKGRREPVEIHRVLQS
jgi:adenylate cyclase